MMKVKNNKNSIDRNNIVDLNVDLKIFLSNRFGRLYEEFLRQNVTYTINRNFLSLQYEHPYIMVIFVIKILSNSSTFEGSVFIKKRANSFIHYLQVVKTLYIHSYIRTILNPQNTNFKTNDKLIFQFYTLHMYNSMIYRVTCQFCKIIYNFY